MRQDLGRLRVERLIVHDVINTLGRDREPPKLSDIESTLTTELRNFFRERIAGTLDSMAVDVEFDPDSDSPLPGLVKGIFESNGANFVEMSRNTAQHLHNCQTAVNSPGLLTVIRGVIADSPVLAILKLEKEAALRAERIERDGKFTYDLEHLPDLMLSEKTKVFKVGLFVWHSDDVIQGLVADKQQGHNARGEVATFFLRKFLGCKFVTAPEVSTKDYFESSQRFINENVSDPKQKATYQRALVAYMTNYEQTVDPRMFATRHLALEDRQPYISFLRGEGQDKTFEKDTTLLAKRLEHIQIELESGISIIGSPTSLDEHMTLTQLEDGRSQIEIQDMLKRVRSK